MFLVRNNETRSHLYIYKLGNVACFELAVGSEQATN